MSGCDHQTTLLYTRRVFADGTHYICVQCPICLDLVKLPEHDNKAYLKLTDVPPTAAVHTWIERP